MKYFLIYDGNCNLCVTFTQLLETFDQGKLFQYIPMQSATTLKQWGITQGDCSRGMILLDPQQPEKKWFGSEAAEEIVRLLPFGEIFMSAYRAIPGAKWLGDRSYAQIRDNRYQWFGSREATYQSPYAPPENS